MNVTKEQAREKIKELVERFGEHVEEYKRGGYNEHQTRVDFIDPFFKALGWDVDNEQGYAEAYREVIHEDKVKVGGSTKAPDYGFTLFGQRKFFVDAKKPSVNIKGDIAPAYQVRRYGWSAKVPISIVTDFEEFSIYDCTQKPKPTDKASVSRIKYLTYDRYLDEFDFLWNVFAKENLPKGRFDKYVQSDTAKKGTATVDDEFLKSIEEWRRYLATTIALRNKSLNEDEINYAVQKTIDRIIFLRMCEDRGVEPYGELKKAAEKGDIYENLFRLYRIADDKYNSGLFDFKEDTITPGLTIDNKVLKAIISEHYYPKCEYEFSVMPADILGSVYERFLGKTIRLTKAHHAKIEEKPEVRKAGGVYYTPKYVVDYIVQNTVGKLVEGKTPKQVEKIKICDPACGSGSFLIGAYEYLLKWHYDYYMPEFKRLSEIAGSDTFLKEREKAVRARSKLPLTPDGKLTTAEKKRILLNNIYGVDIDAQAVEVTKLNLLLKALEGETNSSITAQMIYGERVLPNLDKNIKCGNSLVDMDYYDGQIDFGDTYKINPFNWKRAFHEVFRIRKVDKDEDIKRHNKKVLEQARETEQRAETLIQKYSDLAKEPSFEYGLRGFDVVIGNPPYARIQSLHNSQPEIIEYYRERYRGATKGNFDIYVLFLERGYQLLNKNGILGFILPHKFFQAGFGVGIRNYLSAEKSLNQVVHFGAGQVFSDVTTYTCLLFLDKQQNKRCRYVQAKGNPEEAVNNLINNNDTEPGLESYFVNQPEENRKWHFLHPQKQQVIEKLEKQSQTLGDVTRKIFQGIATSADKIYVLEKIDCHNGICRCYSRSLDSEVEIEEGLVKPFLMGKEVKRYTTPDPKSVVIFPYLISEGKASLMSQDYIKEHFPMGWQYLLANKKALQNRERGRFKINWWQFSRPQNLTEFEIVKVMTPDISIKPNFSIDETSQFYHTTTIYGFSFNKTELRDCKFFLALLNSSTMWFYLQQTGTTLRGGYFRFKTEYLKPFPIPDLDLSNPDQKKQHDWIVSLVNNLLQLNKELQSATLETQRQQIRRTIDRTERKIDELVYQLYGLTEEEIEIIEKQ